MPKLAIYVPKHEMREIERWRKTLNFSRIFMQALKREIRRRSQLAEASGSRLQAAARHYRALLAQDAEPLLDFGYRLGMEHVLNCRLTPEVIRRLLPLAADEELDEQTQAIVEQAVGKDVARIDDFCKQSGFSEATHPFRRRDAFRGYLRGVADAWEQVCEAMKQIES